MDDRELYRKAISLVDGGQNVALVTVVATTGSTPGKEGFKMLVFDGGKSIAGTVGGGLVEGKMIEEAARMLDRPTSRTFRFDLAGTAEDERGICGGSVELLIETFDAAALPVLAERARTAEENLADAPMLILCGAGHVSYYIARYAKGVHFRVTVCDDRAEYANSQRFPDADEIVVEAVERTFDRVQIDGRSYIVVVTRGHTHDTTALEQALKTPARYIGMIGSKRKTLTILEKLREQGVPQEQLSRVYSPIGVSIGAVTPEEIALSIVCELVKIRRLGDESPISHMTLSRREGQP
jgi:xanthine dehydrogenase accessory factor